jgi:hypothetical protein
MGFKYTNLLAGTADGSWINSIIQGEQTYGLSDDKYNGMSIAEKDISNSTSQQQAARFRVGVIPKSGQKLTVSYFVRYISLDDTKPSLYIFTYSQKELSDGSNAAKCVNGVPTDAIGSSYFTLKDEWAEFSTTYEYKEDCTAEPMIVIGRVYPSKEKVIVQVTCPMVTLTDSSVAWAPADGETISGGGAQMSANLWSDSTASMQIRADGTYLVVKSGTAELNSNVTGLSSLTENQTIYMSASLKGAGAGVLKPFVEYKDAAGNLNWVGFPSWQTTDSWQRFEGTCVVPSGMTVCGVGFDSSEATGDIELSNPVFNYGSTGIVMAAGSVTVASINDVASTTRYYMLQSSTLTTPAAPTANPPGGSWAATEPTYTEGSTNSLYFVDETIFSDGTWAYSDVSLSTSYEAAKAAYNKAAAAAAAAAATAQHFWADDSGAHVSSTGDHDTSGFHQLMTSVRNAFMHGSTELMTISENLIELGKNSTSAVIEFCGKLAQISAKKWTWLEDTRTGIDIHSTYGTSISADTYTSCGASVEATQCAVDGSTGGAVNLNGRWLDLYGMGMDEAYQASMKDVANALDAYFTVRRSAGTLTSYNNCTMHYTKIGTWIGTNEADTLKLRVMTGRGFNGLTKQNSEIDIFIKKSNTTSGTTGAFGVTYELHNAGSADLSAYVVATAYNSCDIWIKNSWGYESGWYIAEYNGGTWSDGGSLHQTYTPSGTAQNTACTGAAVYSGSKTFSRITTPDFNFLSNSEYTAITGHAPNKDFDTITVCSGDDSSYRGIMTASIQTSGNIIIRCDPAPNNWIRVNYTITTS